MNLNNPNLGGAIAAAFGFLFLLIIPFDQFLVPFELDTFKTEYLGDALKNLVIIGFGILIIINARYTKVSGLTSIRPKNAYLVVIPLYFVLAGPIQYALLDYQFESIKTIDIAILLFSMMTVGLSEEVIFRGYILPHLIKGNPSNQSLVIPLFLSAFLFGVLHFLNLLQADSHFITVLAQVTYATMFGVGFGIILLRTGSIYPIGFLHGIINFSSNWDDLPGAIEPDLTPFRTAEAIISVIIVLPFFLYMLREYKKTDKDYLG